MDSDKELQTQSRVEDEATWLICTEVVNSIEEGMQIARFGYQRPPRTLADNRSLALEVCTEFSRSTISCTLQAFEASLFGSGG